MLEALASVIVGVDLAYEDGTHSRQARNVRNTRNGTNPRVAATIEWNDEVFVNTSGGTPYVVVRVGENDRRGSYVSGSGARTLRFEYRLTAADDDADSARLIANSLRLNGGTIRDADQMDAAVEHGDDSVEFPETTDPPVPPVTPVHTDPLTANFQSVPAEHTGTGTFEVALHLSEEIADLSYQTLRNGAIEASGGSVNNVSRRNAPSNASWTVRIEPAGYGDVRVSLPSKDCDAANSVCTADGRPVSNSPSVTVQGPVGISVEDTEVEEGENASADFVVRLSRPGSSNVTVDYATSDGTAQAGVDYTGTNGSVTIPAGSTTATVNVDVLDDDHDEGSETFTLTLSNPSTGRLLNDSATGTISNHDPLPQALMARFGRTAAQHVIENVEQRMAARRQPGVEVQIAGYDMFGEAPARNHQRNTLDGLGTPGREAGNLAQGFDDQGLDPLATAAFEMNRATEHGGTLSLWSRSTRSSFTGQEGALSLNGQVQTRLFGADYAKGQMVMGLAVGDTQGLGSYSRTAGGEVGSRVTGLYPWIGYQATERISVWTVAGYGSGSLQVTPTGDIPLETHLSMGMAAAGARGELIDNGAGRFGLAIKTDALWVGTSSDGVDHPTGRMAAAHASVSRMRAGLESSRETHIAGTVLTPSIEVALRHDGGDAETGFGIDIGGGIRIGIPRSGLAVDLRMRRVVIHEAAQFQDRSLSLALSYDPTPSALGLNMRVTPTWGTDSGGNALWNAQPLGGIGGNSETGDRRVDGEVSYGLPVGTRFVGTPRFGFQTSEHGRGMLVGYQLGFMEARRVRFAFGVDVERLDDRLSMTGPYHRMQVRSVLGW